MAAQLNNYKILILDHGTFLLILTLEAEHRSLTKNRTFGAKSYNLTLSIYSLLTVELTDT